MYSKALAVRSSAQPCGSGTKGNDRRRSSYSAIPAAPLIKSSRYLQPVSPPWPLVQHRSFGQHRQEKKALHVRRLLVRIICKSKNFGINTQTVLKDNSLQVTA